ncbi:MAG TPA: solute carrier family 23 protein [Symbiobacteriaceae bacterium]|jgi:uracil permease|nr:solute carrier family 23 protein [Symbiobacteriaceae bacterium]
MARDTTDLLGAQTRTHQGYLPTDRPPFWTTFLSGWQVLIAVFPATVLVAILTHFDIGTTLLTSGLSTIVAVLASKGRIPFYYGSSFAYIAAVGAIVAKHGGGAEGIRIAQGGIVGSGILQIVVGLIIMALGKKVIDTLLPPILTGSVAIVIGISLSQTALSMAASNWSVALVTLAVTVFASVYLQRVRFWGLFPVLIGAVAGYIFAYATGNVNTAEIAKASLVHMPPIMLPLFDWRAILAIAPMALATIPETTAHLYQFSLYVDKEAEVQGRPPQGTASLLGQAVAYVGLSDFINGLFGGPAGTNYGEANATMAITKNYSNWSVLAAGIFAVLLAFIGVLTAAINSVPTAVVGGLSIYLFGVIGKQGVALIASEKVDLTDTRNLAIGALVLVIGIGGSFFPDPAALAAGKLVFTGELPISVLGMSGLPAIATASVLGILLNLVFTYLPIPGMKQR